MKLNSLLGGLASPLILIAAMAPGLAAVEGDAARGESLYEARCTGCHSLDSNRVGPMHRGVFGRRVGGVTDYAYSAALAGSKLTWDDETLDGWLSNPQDFIPGQRMNVRVKEAQDRADLIAYLKQESLELGN